MTADIITFPGKKPQPEKRFNAIDNEEMGCPHMALATRAIDALVFELMEAGYDPLAGTEMIEDLSVVLNSTYAMLLRENGRYHVLHPMMEEMANYLAGLKKQMDDHSGLFDE